MRAGGYFKVQAGNEKKCVRLPPSEIIIQGAAAKIAIN